MSYRYKKNVHVHFISRMMKMDILYRVFFFLYRMLLHAPCMGIIVIITVPCQLFNL